MTARVCPNCGKSTEDSFVMSPAGFKSNICCTTCLSFAGMPKCVVCGKPTKLNTEKGWVCEEHAPVHFHCPCCGNIVDSDRVCEQCCKETYQDMLDDDAVPECEISCSPKDCSTALEGICQGESK